MHISKHDANQIVNEMSNIISQDINMMDSKGVIIASTDPMRVGQIHEVAQKIIEQNLVEMTVENDFEFEGTKQGVNMPILFDGETIGVIGITGKSDKVKKYGQIIEKMTEILILDIYVKEQKSIKDQIKNRYLDKWILGNIPNTDQALINEGLNLGIDITLPYRIMMVAISQTSHNKNIADEQIIMDEIGRTIKKIISEKDGNFVISKGSSIVCLVSACSDTQMMFLAQTISKQIQLDYGVTLVIGVDSSALGIPLQTSSVRYSFILYLKVIN
jgi:carbohydrate diacid regulator